MLERLKSELNSIDEQIKFMEERKNQITYEQYSETYRPQHIKLLKQKWSIRQQLFELIHEDKMGNPDGFIPHETLYCYSKDGMDCPFWSKEKNFEHQESGYCYYLKQGDWDSEGGWSLIWDMTKECGVSEFPE